MANMGYCRFGNTLGDLHDCEQALAEIGGNLDQLSSEEKRAAEHLIELCKRIAEDFE